MTDPLNGVDLLGEARNSRDKGQNPRCVANTNFWKQATFLSFLSSLVLQHAEGELVGIAACSMPVS